MHMGYVHEPGEDDPELALRHFGRALEFLRLENRAAAVGELRQVLQYDPDFSEARAKLRELTEGCDGSFPC